MELRHLRYFEAIAECGNVTRAAERLGISQPSLSQAMKELEADVGRQLFVRGPRGSVLTEAGREFSRHAADILSRVPRAFEAARLAAQGAGGQLVLGFTGSSVFDVVPPLLRRAAVALPGVTLRLLEMLTDKQIESLRSRRIDAAIGRPLHGEPGLVSRVIGQRAVIAALHVSHPLARQAELRLADLRNQPLVVPQRRPGPGFHSQLMALLARAHLDLHVAHEATHLPTVVGLVAAGLGIGLVSDELRHLEVRDVVYRPLAEGRQALQLAISWRQDDDARALAALVDLAATLDTDPGAMRAA
ncbi:LysR family transcriptional regulator [Aquabacterium sp. J223]|uniref:LysR family transcriptional regulator n=1 Tax=Aquabacterium sp. J223 TaxID=2898431 RepID=UPI0021AD9BEB|nr:LysR family transcriptional regulator [Aquabacterium sp. J223]UUX95413.1 LysR family transcriptional regulator [Aquabacterium sp. J223]